MKEQLLKRVEQLRSELESCQRMLAELETKRQNLQQTLLRISGAIQVLEEECAKEPTAGEDGDAIRDEPAPRMAVAGR